MVRKLVSVLILMPLAVIVISLAVANRQAVVIALDPFDTANPALAVTLPLFALLLAALIAGVVLGGAAAWLRQSKWRRAARLAESQARELQEEVEELRAQSIMHAPALGGMPEYGSRFTLAPPAA